MEFMDDYRRIYASWLGKLIGVRLGSPIENWTYEQIRDTYAPIRYYTTDYGQYAADDDINGPFFFAQVMNEKGITDVTAQDMGNNMLNVVAPLHGFYWWGGPGVATEHTAYANLQKGIKAPRSGSAEVNGKTIAEQIGGQIFSDCWGFLSLGDPQEAADLAAKMSSVTHDLDGIEGGKFVAAAIALAWHMRDAVSIIRETRNYLDPNSTYTALINEFLAFHEEHPDDPDACLDYIHRNHGYDKYPGVCHILPNTAIMLYGMLYGYNDFDETLRLIAEAGCDTDCNLGNVGAIMGMMVGLEGIDEKWITPFNDILLFSSAIGTKNIQTVSGTAFWFTVTARRLHGLPSGPVSPFALPYASNGFKADENADHAVRLDARHGELRIILDRMLENEHFFLRKQTYFRPQDVYDVRYEPQFSGILEPGDTVTFCIENDRDLPLSFTPYIKDYAENYLFGEKTQAGTIVWSIPEGMMPILETGLLVECSAYTERTLFRMTDFRIEKHPHAEMDFRRTCTEDWGTDIGLVRRYGLSGLLIHEGNAHTGEDGVILEPHSAVNFSGPDTLYQYAELTVQADKDTDFLFSWSFTGVRRHTGIHLRGQELYSYHLHDDEMKETLLGTLPADTETTISFIRCTNTVHAGNQTFTLPERSEERGSLSIGNASDNPLTLIACNYQG